MSIGPMWKQLLSRLTSRVTGARVRAKTQAPFYVYRVHRPSGPSDIVSLLSEDVVFELGLVGAAIVGESVHLLKEGERLADTNFRPNPAFVRLLHDVIARNAPGLPGLQAEARRQGTGWVYMIDARTPTPGGPVPPQDIIGAFEARNGEVIPNSYQPSTNHRLLTTDGLFGLEPKLHERLMERINELVVASQHQPV